MPCPTNLECEPGREIRDETLSNPEFHPYVIHSMVDAEEHQKDYWPAVIDLTNKETITDELCLTLCGVIGLSGGNRDNADTSFSRQMHMLLTDKPDAFLATYRSGIPLLKAVEGFYEALGIITPILETVDVGGKHCDKFSVHDIKNIQENETRRLEHTIGGAKVVILDEFFASGYTIRRASEIARNAGATSVKAVCGQWYRKIDKTSDRRTNLQIETLLNEWSDLMLDIGHNAAAVPPSTRQRPSLELVLQDPFTRDDFDFYVRDGFVSM